VYGGYGTWEVLMEAHEVEAKFTPRDGWSAEIYRNQRNLMGETI
jgi:hypothetical protein